MNMTAAVGRATRKGWALVVYFFFVGIMMGGFGIYIAFREHFSTAGGAWVLYTLVAVAMLVVLLGAALSIPHRGTRTRSMNNRPAGIPTGEADRETHTR